MLSLDCIREIAYFANYKTIKLMIEVLPKLNDIWRYKCKNYLDFYSGEENYLIQRGKAFVLILSLEGYNYKCQDILFEYNDVLIEMMNILNKDDDHRFVYFKPKKRIVVIELANMNVVGQCSTVEEARQIIKSDKRDPYDTYMIVNMASITPHFIKYGRLTTTMEVDYKLICPVDLQ